MKKEIIFMFLIFAFFSLSINFSIAFERSCEVRAKEYCTPSNSPWSNIVMYLNLDKQKARMPNAPSIPGDGFDYVLCCNYPGSTACVYDQDFCDALGGECPAPGENGYARAIINDIIGINQSFNPVFNGLIESPCVPYIPELPDMTNYPNRACYKAMYCIGISAPFHTCSEYNPRNFFSYSVTNNRDLTAFEPVLSVFEGLDPNCGIGVSGVKVSIPTYNWGQESWGLICCAYEVGCNNDNIADWGEACDGSDLQGQTCETLGFDGGDLSCNQDCTFNTSLCCAADGCNGNCPGNCGSSEDPDCDPLGCCGDNICQDGLEGRPDRGENCSSCPQDCGTCPSTNCKLTDAYWDKTEVHNGEPVLLKIKHNENCNNQEVEFLMYENDWSFGMDEVTSQLNHPPENITLTSGSGINQRIWITEWIEDTGILQQDPDPEYKFLARLVNNHSVSIISTNELKVSNESPSIPDFCSDEPAVTICSDYNDSVNCTTDPCNLSHFTNVGNNCIEKEYCEWNGSVCQTKEEEICPTPIGDVEIGTCIYSDVSNDNCDDEYLNHSWTATWIWAEENNFSEGGEGFIPLGNGYYAYDPNNESGNCKAGQEILRCSSKIELNFFGWINAFLIIAILFAYYFYQKRKTPKKRKRK